MNKIKCLFIVCFMFGIFCFNFSSVMAEEAGGETEIDTSVFEYERSSPFGDWDGTFVITKYNGTDETVVVPSEIDGNKIKRIDNSAFETCESIKHLIIQEGISEIGIAAFGFCKNLETATLPEGITDIECHAFEKCKNLSKINIPGTVKKIEEYTFYKCKSLQTIEVPNSITKIGYGAFACCSNLNYIEVPTGVVEIDCLAFSGCNLLTKIILSDTVKSIASNAFVSCIELDIAGFAPTETILKNLVIYADSDSYARNYANQNGIKFICLNEHNWDNGIITINPTVKNKGQKTYSCTTCNLKKTEEIPTLYLPRKGGNITDPGSKNTYKVTNPATQDGTVELTVADTTQKSITIPESITVDGAVYKVTSVSKNAFRNNKKIKKITVGKNIKTIGAGTFSGCKNLKEIIIKSKQIKTVGKNAFKGISSKAKIKVPRKKFGFYKELFAKKGQKSSVKIIK